ncbi:hypothetical protein NC652_026643 [Populus alba x Populus x berolinensis]|nr:hypothetical protein NC652_026643 [Populus alba x Populus x berolinensis]
MVLIKEPIELHIRRAEAKGSGCFRRLYLGNLKPHRNSKRFSDSIDKVHKVYACFKTEDCLAKQKCFKECGERYLIINQKQIYKASINVHSLATYTYRRVEKPRAGQMEKWEKHQRGAAYP